MEEKKSKNQLFPEKMIRLSPLNDQISEIILEEIQDESEISIIGILVE